MRFNCWKCGEAIQVPTGNRLGHRDACPACDADLHACRNCRFYDPGKNNECAEPQAEWTRGKEAANYCNYFSPNLTLFARRNRPASQVNDAKKRFDSLFNT